MNITFYYLSRMDCFVLSAYALLLPSPQRPRRCGVSAPCLEMHSAWVFCLSPFMYLLNLFPSSSFPYGFIPCKVYGNPDFFRNETISTEINIRERFLPALAGMPLLQLPAAGT